MVMNFIIKGGVNRHTKTSALNINMISITVVSNLVNENHRITNEVAVMSVSNGT